MSLTLLIGGARSGKSSLAVELGRRSGLPVTFIATAPTIAIGDIDAEMATRIDHHRRERPESWTTIEEPVAVAAALAAASGTFVIVDCLTLWVSNLMFAGRTDDEIDQLTDETVALGRSIADPIVVVSNEVGMGIHPDVELGRRYRDVLGRVNQRWAIAADVALLMIAGRALRLDDPTAMLAVADRTTSISPR